MSLATNLSDLTTRVATECKALRTLLNGNAANLSALTTTAKGNLVAALNEVKALADTAASQGGAEINDAATATGTVWSSQKVSDVVNAAITGLAANAPAALDTIDELAAALGDDANFGATVTTALGNRVRTDTNAQGLNATQKGNARTNIDAANAADVGDTSTDFVAVFNAGLV